MNNNTNNIIPEDNASDAVSTQSADTDTVTVSSEVAKQRGSGPLGFLYDLFEIMIVAVIAVLIIFTFVFRLCSVDGSSMYDTLEDGQQVITADLFYKPSQGDIVVFHMTSSQYPSLNKPLVKRVIGLPGQTVKIDFGTGIVTVDGVELKEDYISLLDINLNEIGRYTEKAQYNMSGNVFTVTVPEGYVFVMGDNRNNSLDSRYTAVGCVDIRRILGKVVLRVTPFGKFGTVE